MKGLVVAWLTSSAAFSFAFVGFMLLWVWLDDGTLRPLGAILRLASLALGAALIVQLLYGVLVYVLLTRLGLWRLWIVALAYLVPLLVISWFTTDTPREAWGTIGWVILLCIVAYVFWFLAPARSMTE
jgi:hypothetical protein